MRLDDFDFELPEERIALRPARPRDAARLLVVGRGGRIEDKGVGDLPALLVPGDILVVNDTRVIPAALKAVRPARPHGGGADVTVDVNLFERAGPQTWRALVRPAKRLRPDDRLAFVGGLTALVESKSDGGAAALRFDRAGSDLDAAISAAGVAPLPPYIARRRAADARDAEDYQTVFAANDGSVAAPTAGLHFTDELLAAIERRGVRRLRVTLHVGPGTFLPVKSERLEAHTMHAERCVVSAETADALNAARRAGGRIIPVGTTSLRTLETAAGADGEFRAFDGETDLFIAPGYRFKAADALMTNFHLPKSTLFVLVCAFAGTSEMKAAYAHAVAAGYRFYSYGDACFLDPARG